MSSPVTPTFVNFIQAQPFSLSGSGASIGDTTLTLQSMVGIDGNNIVTADIGSFGYGTLEPGNGTQEEAVLFTGITQNANGTATLTGVSSIGFKQPYTLTTGVQKTHAGASKFILSNDAAFYNNLVLYINSVATSGAPNASTTVKGILQAATAAQINSGTATGSTGAILAVTPDALATSIYGTIYVPPSGEITMFAGASAPSGWLLCDGTAYSRSTYAALFAVVSTTYGAGDGSTTFNVPDLRGRSAVGAGTGAKTLIFSSLATGTSTITITGAENSTTNEIQTGQAVTFVAGSGTITGLTNNTVYYMVRSTNTSFMLASSLANAYTSTAISLSGSTGNPTFTYALTARALADTGGEETHALLTSESQAHVHVATVTSGLGSVSGGSLNGAASGNTSSTGGSTPHNNMSPFLALNFIIKQ